MPGHRHLLAAGLALAAGAAALPLHAAEDRIVLYKVEAPYETVLQDVSDAIINRGFVIDYTAHIGDMLNRTAADVGAKKQVYRKAEATQFCSATLSRRAMEADPANIAFCPYVVFTYQTEAEPGQVTVGFRRLDETGSPESKEALAAVNELLDEIAQEAAGQ